MIKRLEVTIFCISFFTGLLLLSCEGNNAFTTIYNPDKESKVILKIEGYKIPLSSFHKYIETNFSDEDISLDDEILSRFLDYFIEEQILLREARKNFVIVSNTEVNIIAEQMKVEQSPLSDKFSLDREWRESIRNSLIVQKFISEYVMKDLNIQLNDIEDYYENHKEEFMVPEEVKVRQILVETEQEANRVLAELRGRRADFPQLAQQYSISPEAPLGGDMGYFRKGQLPQEFENVIFSLRERQYSSVIPSGYGFHIFYVEEIRPSGQLPLVEVRDPIRIRMLQEKSEAQLKEYVARLKEEIPIKIYYKNLDFKYQDHY